MRIVKIEFVYDDNDDDGMIPIEEDKDILYSFINEYCPIQTQNMKITIEQYTENPPDVKEIMKEDLE